ncbi:hypothetical protein T02_3174 [Trichinella nativa]|uniref:Uncharacterized protein n=1 Tax=Trichinella nativa TaxID=6335 RepID=A0A0V1L2T0_9BILA|nr:hypothetical protein T02_3174 [Trichinella nativa]
MKPFRKLQNVMGYRLFHIDKEKCFLEFQPKLPCSCGKIASKVISRTMRPGNASIRFLHSATHSGLEIFNGTSPVLLE